MSDEQMPAWASSMEQRLMRRINDNQEAILAELRNLRSEHDVTRQMVTALPATVLGEIEKPLLSRLTAVEARLSKLEQRDD